MGCCPYFTEPIPVVYVAQNILYSRSHYRENIPLQFSDKPRFAHDVAVFSEPGVHRGELWAGRAGGRQLPQEPIQRNRDQSLHLLCHSMRRQALATAPPWSQRYARVLKPALRRTSETMPNPSSKHDTKPTTSSVETNIPFFQFSFQGLDKWLSSDVDSEFYGHLRCSSTRIDIGNVFRIKG